MTGEQYRETGDTSPSSSENTALCADCPIVGIGASAGGLRAFEKFFTHMPAHSGMAFVLVQHLHTPQKSLLVDLIRHYTIMEVSQVEDGVRVIPNHVYIIPPGQDLVLLHGKLLLMAPPEDQSPHLPIDYFFRSLAQDQGKRALCIVLSGTGSDGTLGLQAVRQAGGVALVQDPEEAEYDGMPRSAINSGQVDYILPVTQMPQQLLTYVDHAHDAAQLEIHPVEQPSALQKILVVLRDKVGHDFSLYKANTLQRRIERRMIANEIDDLDKYARYVQTTPIEANMLFRELLISVTSFFRDPEAFDALATHVMPKLLAENGHTPLRLWVPGCASGEEAYSIAILLREAMAETGHSCEARIFATDIDAEAIQVARVGRYPMDIAADIPPERLKRYFIEETDTYRVTATIREMVTFAEQDIIADPPFSSLDLISCRNLLIYLNPQLQDKVIPLFHFALRPDRYLFLGTSESADKYADLFLSVDKRSKIYRRLQANCVRRQPLTIPLPPSPSRIGLHPGSHAPHKREVVAVQDLIDRALIDHYAPACAVVDESGGIRYFSGRTGKYLEPAPGQATLNIVEMAREGLRLELPMALHRARSGESVVHSRNLKVKTNGDYTTIDLTIRPVAVPPGMPMLWMVAFEEIPLEDLPADNSDYEGEEQDHRIIDLKNRLRATEERLQATVEQLQSTNEELKSSNEELQSSNEELQSTNEELETSKEELQSMNEELRTANTELKTTNEELAITNNDMQNLLVGTGIATIFLDENLSIRRFTPAVSQIINIIESDVGRPLNDLSSKLITYDELFDVAREVLDTLVPQSSDLQSRDGRVYRLRIQPYRTQQNVIEGVVLTFVDISELELTRAEAASARDLAANIVDTVREPLLVLSDDLCVLSANHAFYEAFQVCREETQDRRLYDLGNGQWDIPELRILLEEILPEDTVLKDYIVYQDFPGIGERKMALNARELHQSTDQKRRILLAIEDLTPAAPLGQPGEGKTP